MNTNNINSDDLSIQSSDMGLSSIFNLYKLGTLNLNPKYQRRDRWDKTKQSQLIESFFLNIPVPPVYLAEAQDDTLDVIDGKQRLTAIKDFFSDKLILENLQFLKEFEGKIYSDILDTHKKTISIRPLRIVTIMNKSNDLIKHEVFIRLNRGGQPLNAQELRNVVNAGKLNDSIILAAENKFLRQQLKIKNSSSKSYTDMTDVESVVRFLALNERIDDFNGDIRKTLDNFMWDHRRDSEKEVNVLINKFLFSINWASDLWGDVAFQRYDPKNKVWRSQMIFGMYDAQMLSLSKFNEETLSKVSNNILIEETKAAFSNEKFEDSVRTATNTPSKLRYRVEIMEKAIEKSILDSKDN